VPPQLIIALLVLGAAAIFLNAFLKASPANVAKNLKRYAIYLGVTLLILFAATGRLHWLFALIGSLFAALPRLAPLLRYIPLLKWFQSRQQSGGFGRKKGSSQSGKTNGSKVSARYVTMTLNHETGELEGEVIDGRFAGQRLSAMSVAAIVQLYEECLQNDNESAALVESYLDRIHGETWRQAKHNQTSSHTDGNMPHTEALEITYDPQKIQYEELLKFFFQIHDPTTLNRQGNDIGSQYRSAIFVKSQEEADAAVAVINAIQNADFFQGNVVTEIVQLRPFYRAEPEHQDYLERYPNGYTCHFIRDDWKKAIESALSS